jgi:hypothetical protein
VAPRPAARETWPGPAHAGPDRPPDVYESKASWYDPRLHYADFVVSTTGGGPDPVSYRIAVADFGRPARIYYFGGHTIMIWDKNLLPNLGAPRTP